jgi:hypothetical protein
MFISKETYNTYYNLTKKFISQALLDFNDSNRIGFRKTYFKELSSYVVPGVRIATILDFMDFLYCSASHPVNDTIVYNTLTPESDALSKIIENYFVYNKIYDYNYQLNNDVKYLDTIINIIKNYEDVHCCLDDLSPNEIVILLHFVPNIIHNKSVYDNEVFLKKDVETANNALDVFHKLEEGLNIFENKIQNIVLAVKNNDINNNCIDNTVGNNILNYIKQHDIKKHIANGEKIDKVQLPFNFKNINDAKDHFIEQMYHLLLDIIHNGKKIPDESFKNLIYYQYYSLALYNDIQNKKLLNSNKTY